MRLSFGISQRLVRISPDNAIRYGSHVIPPGVPFSMTSYLQHRDPRLFPDPDVFRPERWLSKEEGGAKKHPLARYVVPFGRGPRMCLGMNLATVEMYLVLGHVFRRLDLELFETGRDAVDLAADFFIPIPKKGTQGVRAIVR